jgi:UDP-glucose 4-epimerase
VKENNNWLITGGCGFIGRSLLSYLINENPETNIRVLDNLSGGRREDLSEVAGFSEKDATTLGARPEGVEFVFGDVRDLETCVACSEGTEIVVHLAANADADASVEDPLMDMRSNVVGTLNMLEAARTRKACN